MKWTSKFPNNGEWRVVTRFAWWPVRTNMPDDNTIIWLERYETNDRYHGFLEKWLITNVAPLGYWSKK